jgi:hypothetical protein
MALIFGMKGQKPRVACVRFIHPHAFLLCISGNVLMIRARDHFVALATRAAADRCALPKDIPLCVAAAANELICEAR